MARPLSMASGTHLGGGAGTTLQAAAGSTVLPDMGGPADTLAGILCPDVMWALPTLSDYTPFGGGLIRLPGGDAPTSLTVDDGHGGAWFGFIQPVPLPRFQLCAGPPVWAAIAAGTTSFPLTLNAAGPLSSASLPVTLSIASGVVMLEDNILVDTMAGSFEPGATSAGTVTDGAGFFGFGVDGGGGHHLLATSALTPPGLHYGRHDFAIQGAGSASQATSVFIVAERVALSGFTPAGTLYANMVAGDPIGQFTAAVEPGVYALTVVSSDTPITVSPFGQVLAASPHTAGTHTATVLVTSNSGRATSVTFSYSVAAGTTLDPSAMAADFAAGLDNSMVNGTLGTVTVAGMTAPAFTLDVADDEIQHDPSGELAPRYAITSTGNVATITYTSLSAQTDNLVLVAREGSVVCRATIPNTVAWKVGPTKTVGPSSSGSYDFPTWNALADAAWTEPAAYAGVVIELYPQDYSKDFSRTQIGHGSNQQWMPGPWKMIGVNPAGGRVLIDFEGDAPGGAAQGGLMFRDFDAYCENLIVANVSNLNAGEGNAGAFYKVGGTYGNVTLKNCIGRNSNMGWLGGWEGTHIVLDTCAWYNCGNGAGGLVHNVYVGHASSVTATDNISLNTAQVHAFKSRAYRTTIVGGTFADGENGMPGASSNIDLPLGGIVSISGAQLTRGPNPNNDGNWIQFCTEGAPGAINGACHPVNTLSISNCTFQNASPSGGPAGSGMALFSNGGRGAYSPTTGLPPAVTIADCTFYNMVLATWWCDFVSPPVHVTDGGGNVATSTWADISSTDPVYGGTLPAPASSYALNGTGGGAMMADSLAPQIKVAVGTAAGTVVARLTGFDDTGVELTNRTTILTDNAGGMFAVDSATGDISIAGTIANALYFIAGTVYGTTSSGAGQFYGGGYNGAAKNIFIVGGTGGA